MEQFQKVEQKALREVVRDSIRDAILKGSLKPGERIVESRIAREMGVSQAPVREALRELEQAGLVVSYPNRGAVVRELSAKDIREIYSLRALLERHAVEESLGDYADLDFQALESLIEKMVKHARDDEREEFVEADFQFHSFICKKANNQLLYRTWLGISPLNWTYVTSWLGRPMVDLATRHFDLVEVFRTRDPDVGGRAMWDHIMELADEISTAMRRHEKRKGT